MATAVVVDEDHKVGFFVLGAVGRHAATEVVALAGGERGAPGDPGRGGDDVLVQATDHVAEQLAHVTGAILADHDAFAEHRDTAEGLVIAVVAHATVFALGLHQQARIRVRTDELLMAGMRHRSDAAVGGDALVLLLELREVFRVQVGPAGSLCAGGDKRKGDGGSKGTETIHWRFPVAI